MLCEALPPVSMGRPGKHSLIVLQLHYLIVLQLMLHKHFIEVAPTQISSWRSCTGLQGIKVKRINTFITKKEIVLQAILQLGNLLLQEVTSHQGIKMH